jgi:hypothetical protein
MGVAAGITARGGGRSVWNCVGDAGGAWRGQRVGGWRAASGSGRHPQLGLFAVQRRRRRRLRSRYDGGAGHLCGSGMTCAARDAL